MVRLPRLRRSHNSSPGRGNGNEPAAPAGNRFRSPAEEIQLQAVQVEVLIGVLVHAHHEFVLALRLVQRLPRERLVVQGC
ncbi:hypothetical protein AA958_27585 [Streptomyces sp. CNQ-509]|uniref:hypothetical protein n=1 Tax=unclassified Streptomyces TaxID=2593676 RepID=UPI00062DEBF7|nr:hypothetical protein [Streptomyces sp. CNQ-509]AKH85371.1 hypothetical protein AA958_27585 [Streptomyces sp. CNQ-509]